MAAATVLLALPAGASAAVTCSFDTVSGQLSVQVTTGTTVAAIRRAASPSEDIQVDDSSDFLTPLSCTNGPPTVTTTSSISIDESGSVQGTSVTLNFVNGRLEPGLGGEGGTPEIEVSYTADSVGTDLFQVLAGTEASNQHLDFGAAGGAVKGNLNNDDDIDDVTLDSNVDKLQLQPGTGNDSISTDGSAPGGFTGSALLAQTQVLGSQGDDTFHAGGTTSSDNRMLSAAGDGNDTMIGSAAFDTMEMGAGNDTFDGGGGTADFASYKGVITPVQLDLRQTGPQDTGTAGIDVVVNAENIVGGNATDVLIGDNVPNTIFGGNNPGDVGDDVIYGLGGADHLIGHAGNDVLIGGQGDDQLEGDEGTDTASYATDATGPVTLSLSQLLTGVPQVTGGAGSDRLMDGVPIGDSNHEIENLIGSPFGGDVLTGNADANQIDVYDGLADIVDCIDNGGDSDVAVADEVGVDAISNCETTDNAPQTSIASGPTNGATVTTSTPTYGLGADEASLFQVKVDAGSFQACPVACTVSPLANGLHTIAFRAIDSDENFHADLTPAARTVTVAVPPSPDSTPPNTFVSGKKKVKTRKKKARVAFTFTATEPGSSFACSLDGRPFVPCTSPFSAKLRRGAHTLSVVATDTAGNVDATAASFTTRVKQKN